MPSKPPRSGTPIPEVAPSATALRLLRLVYVVLGRPSQQKLPYKDVLALLGTASVEVLKAVASNPNNSYFSSLTELVDVANGAQLPAYEGEPGIPLIVPFPGAEPRAGIPADPDEIDSYRHDLVTGPYRALYSGSVDAKAVACDAPTKLGRVSPTACRYSIVNGRLTFTGDTAQVPIVKPFDSSDPNTAVDQVPSAYEPSVLRLVLSWVGQPWDKFYPICLRMEVEARNDLNLIRAGKPVVPPFSPTMMAQKLS